MANYGMIYVRTAKVWETACEVMVSQKSKSVWEASLTYRGVRYYSSGRTLTAAVSAVQERARYATN